jgi:hypothetical protein
MEKKKNLSTTLGSFLRLFLLCTKGGKKSVVLCILRGKKLKNFGMKEN